MVSDAESNAKVSLLASGVEAPSILKRKKKKEAAFERTGSVTLSGLLNAIDGIASAEGRLLFCTTNHIERIDPALIRPGRCDVRVEFTRLTKYQALKFFEYFYAPLTHSPDCEENGSKRGPGIHEDNRTRTVDAGAGEKDSEVAANPLAVYTAARIRELAESFAERMPDQGTSVSSIQGYLMRFKRQPECAVEEVLDWVASGFSSDPVSAGTPQPINIP